MTETITVTGLVASSPRHVCTSEGLNIASFRLVAARRQFDRATGRWVAAETNWYTVTAFRELARNVGECVAEGQQVIVAGRLRVHEWPSEAGGGVAVEIDAETVGHDLCWGTTIYSRRIDGSGPVADEQTGIRANSAVAHRFSSELQNN
jgi:single-strand DNA-binding protein